MNPVVKSSLKAMEKGIPLAHRLFRGEINGNIRTTDINYVYNPKTGLVLEIWTQDKLDPGKKYHSWTVKTPMSLPSEDYSEIIDYHPPEGLPFEARQNLEDAVSLWNGKHGYSHVLSR